MKSKHCIYHLPSGFLSLRKEEPLPELRLRLRSLAILGHAGPRWRITLHGVHETKFQSLEIDTFVVKSRFLTPMHLPCCRDFGIFPFRSVGCDAFPPPVSLRNVSNVLICDVGESKGERDGRPPERSPDTGEWTRSNCARASRVMTNSLNYSSTSQFIFQCRRIRELS